MAGPARRGHDGRMNARPLCSGLPRSYLFVPATRPERIAKARQSGADAVIVDLEDAVEPDAKASSRAALADASAALAGAAAGTLWLRINALDTPDADADLRLLARLRAGGAAIGVMVPKAGDPEALRALPPDLPVLALIETARGLGQAHRLGEVAAVQRLAFGSIDYALDLGGIDPADHEALRHARSTLVWASRCADLPPPVDGVTPAIDDEAALAADNTEARRLGFAARLCIHPRQVAAVHAALAPTAAERAWAERVVAAAGAGGAVQLDGRMIDRPVLLRAQRLLAAAR